MLAQIEKLYFSTGFIVLDTQPMANPSSQILVVLGRPFLATSIALISCRKGVMKLSFGNITTKMNVFNISNQKKDTNNDSNEVDFLEIIIGDGLLAFLGSCPLTTMESSIAFSQIRMIQCYWKWQMHSLRPPRKIQLRILR